MIRSLLIVLAMLVGTATCAQDALPKFVQNLSDMDYATWATWQNRQADLRAAEEREDSYEEPYVYSVKTSTAVNGGVASSLRQLSKTNRSNDIATRRAVIIHEQSDWRNIASETGQQRYTNPDYVPPGPVTIHNPYARFASPVDRAPSWDKIFVPCKSGTMTVSEALDKLGSPAPAELLFSVLMTQALSK